MLDVMKALMRKKDVCVLATASENKPHCSLMAYVTDRQITTVYMVTHKDSRKYRNLKANPWVSLLIDTRDENTAQERLKTRALTVGGVFEPVLDTGRKERITAAFLKKHPHMETFVQHPDAQVFSVSVKSFLLLEGPTQAYFETVGQ